MTFPDDALDGKPGVTVRCRGNGAVGVTFRGRFSFDADAVHHVGGELCQKRGETGVLHPGDARTRSSQTPVARSPTR
jgi:hypothetical protein